MSSGRCRKEESWFDVLSERGWIEGPSARRECARRIAMKFMLMMHAPRGNGDWNVAQWSPEDIKAMVGYMHDLNKDLAARGELVSAEGLTPPGDARVVRAGKD